MKLSLQIARRLRFKPDDRRVMSPGIVIATAGIAISLVIMLFSVAIVTGFKQQIRDKVTGFSSQINVIADTRYNAIAADSLRFLRLTPELQAAIAENLPKEAEVSLAISQPAIIKTDDDFAGLVLRSLPHGQRRFIAENIVDGVLPDTLASSIVVSAATARKLNLNVGDKIAVHFFVNNGIKTRKMPVSAIYDTHFTDFDEHLAFTSLEFLQKVSRVDSDQGTEIHISGLADEDVDDTSLEVQYAMMMLNTSEGQPQFLQAISVHQSGAMYFDWLNLLDANVTVILILMALVSGFTLISSTFIIILERVPMIGILKTLGMSDSSIRGIFVFLALRLVGIGLVIGNTVGIGLLWAQKAFRILPLDPEAYYLNYVPVDLNVWHIIAINAGVIVISSLMLLLPTRVVCTIKAARLIEN